MGVRSRIRNKGETDRRWGHRLCLEPVWPGLVEKTDVREILFPARCLLVTNEEVAAQEKHGLSIEQAMAALAPGFLKLHPTDSGEQVNSVWFHAKLDNEVPTQEVFTLQASCSKTESLNHRHHAVGIGFFAAYEDVNVSREARSAMEREGPSTNDQILNLVLVEQADKLVQIFG